MLGTQGVAIKASELSISQQPSTKEEMEKEAGLRGLKKAPSGAAVQVCSLTLKTWAHTDIGATVQAHIDAGTDRTGHRCGHPGAGTC